jgi:hypothetical protein
MGHGPQGSETKLPRFRVLAANVAGDRRPTAVNEEIELSLLVSMCLSTSVPVLSVAGTCQIFMQAATAKHSPALPALPDRSPPGLGAVSVAAGRRLTALRVFCSLQLSPGRTLAETY